MASDQKLKAALKKSDNTSKGKRVSVVDGNKDSHYQSAVILRQRSYEVNELKKEGIRVSPQRINKSYQVQQQTNKEARKWMKWTPELKTIFLKAVKKLGLDEAQPLEILKFMKTSGAAPKDLTRDHVASHLQKIHSKVKRMKDALRDEIMNTTYQLDLSSSPKKLATAAGNMCLQYRGNNWEVLLGADGSLPSSSQDQAAGNGPNNTSDDGDWW